MSSLNLHDIIKFNEVTLRVSTHESRLVEFKCTYDVNNSAKYRKAMAAFSNADGGRILFGIAEKPRRIVGIDTLNIPDCADITNSLSAEFSPCPQYDIEEYDVHGKIVIAIHVLSHRLKPIICTKVGLSREDPDSPRRDPVTRIGAIYVRNSGRTEEANAQQISAMVETRIERRVKSFLENMRIIEKVGPERVGIVDASTPPSEDGVTSLYISRETAAAINFIDKGRFVETTDEGDPAFMIVGNYSLKRVFKEPLPDEDRHSASDVVSWVEADIKSAFPMIISPLDSSLPARFLKSFRAHGTGDYSFNDPVAGKHIYRKAAGDFIRTKIQEDPHAAIRAFARKALVEQYEAFIDPDANTQCS